ncbi:SdrD B-like domain-containing protein [Kitasatospora sp. NPDC004615]|uniref:SdrD B-like domain-containing protein n=1 Tax=Kitasatospora sp. NPDC004615 TaxID=3364017 RepID=UPI0036CFAA9A
MPTTKLARVGLCGLLLVGGTAGAVVAGAGQAGATATDGTLTVQVLRDFFGTGVINTAMDVPQRGMKISVTDPAGRRVTGTTDVTGKVVVAPSGALTGGRYRVDVTVPAPFDGYLRAAPASTAPNHFDSFTSFVDVSAGKDASVITGVWDAADYTEPDVRYFVPVQTDRVMGSDTRALVSFGKDVRGTCPTGPACPTVLDTQQQVGTTSGLAYDKYRGRLFQAAFARRFTAYGPEGGDAIYAVPADGGSAPTLFARVPGSTETAHGTNMIKDAEFVDAPGKESIGGLALSEDGSTLYAVNMLTRSLVSFDATGSEATGPENTVAIPDPGCAASGDWRPAGLAVHDNTLYVGGVCSAESTQKRADLKAVVYGYDGKRFTKVLSQALDFERSYVSTGGAEFDQTHYWNPWHAGLDNWDSYQLGNWMVYPEPELASMAFARDGSMILGFRDRFMDVASVGLDPRPGNNKTESGYAGGDINMACAVPTGGYAWEGTGNCPNHAATNTPPLPRPSGVVSYFAGDFAVFYHQETSLGGVAFIPQQQWVISTQMDPTVNYFTSGTGYYDIDTGAGPGNKPDANGYEFVQKNGFGKAGGLGDIAYTAANAPVQIGNRVWFDGDHNGIQDAGEASLPGVTVNLLDAEGKVVATTKTDANGEYYFGGVGAAYQLTPGADYTVEFDVSTADTSGVPGKPAAADLRYTLPTAGDDRVHDSNVIPPTEGPPGLGHAQVTAPSEPGGVDHTIDAGVYVPEATPSSSASPSPSPSDSASPSPEPSGSGSQSPSSSPSPSASPSESSSPTASVPPAGTTPAGPAPTSTPKGSLAFTGSSGTGRIVLLGALLVGAGAALVLLSRKRHARRH